MATFEVKVVRIDSAEKHPNADKLTINRVGGYTAITNLKEDGSWRFQTGDLAVYVPENAMIPEPILKMYGYWNEEQGKGLLGGKLGDRVRPLKLRQVYSEGLLFPLNSGTVLGVDGRYAPNVAVGDDVVEVLGITKYEPPIPASMAGQVEPVDGLPKYDVEAYEKYVDVLTPGEEVVATEKLHGTFTGFSFLPNVDATRMVVYSKGLGSQGLAFKAVPENAGNLYVRSLNNLFEEDRVDAEKFWDFVRRNSDSSGSAVHFFGETFGPGVQDLHYGLKKPMFRLFDIYIGHWGRGFFLPYDQMLAIAEGLGIRTVPLLYRGPFDLDTLVKFRDAKDSLSGSHVREGLVVKPVHERYHDELGRIHLKMVSPDYKLRKGGGEELS